MAGEEAGELGFGLAVEREAADRDFEFFGEFFFLGTGARPGGEEPTGVFVGFGEVGLEISELVAFLGVFFAELEGSFEEGLVDGVERFDDITEEFFFFEEGFFGRGLVAALEADFAFLEVTGSDFDAEGNAFFDPFPFFGAAAEVAVIDEDAEVFASVGLFAKALGEGVAGLGDRLAGVFFGGDGNDDDLLRGDAGWKDEAVVVGVDHDEGADEAGGNAPRGGVDKL